MVVRFFILLVETSLTDLCLFDIRTSPDVRSVSQITRGPCNQRAIASSKRRKSILDFYKFKSVKETL